MNNVLPGAVCCVFLALSAWHFKMAFSAKSNSASSVPSVDGKPLFMPSRRATIAVGVLLVLFAALVAATAGWLLVGLPRVVLASLSYGLALGLLARAIGEFKYVGLFKRAHGSRFARLDTYVYSPLCLLLAVGVALVAWTHRT